MAMVGSSSFSILIFNRFFFRNYTRFWKCLDDYNLLLVPGWYDFDFICIDIFVIIFIIVSLSNSLQKFKQIN